VTAALAVRAAGRGLLPARSGPAPANATRVDVNRASVAVLQTLPGIGPGRARALVLHRVRHGWFRQPADLLAVDGLGPSTVAELLAHIEFGAHPGERRR